MHICCHPTLFYMVLLHLHTRSAMQWMAHAQLMDVMRLEIYQLHNAHTVWYIQIQVRHTQVCRVLHCKYVQEWFWQCALTWHAKLWLSVRCICRQREVSVDSDIIPVQVAHCLGNRLCNGRI